MKKICVKIFATVLFFTLAIQSGQAFAPNDKAYKEALIKSSGHPEYTMKNMKSNSSQKTKS